MTAKDVSEKINRLMKERGWTPYQLSKHSNVSLTTCYEIQKGSFPRIDTIERICDCLGISLGDFFSDENQIRKEYTPIQTEVLREMEKMDLHKQKHLLEYVRLINKK